MTFESSLEDLVPHVEEIVGSPCPFATAILAFRSATWRIWALT